MERIALIIGTHILYWSSIVLTLAAAAAVCVFLAAYFGKGGNLAAGFVTVPLALVCSVVLARLIHWYCYAESYDSLASAMTDYTTGSYALIGAFAGCVLTAVLTRLLHLHRNLPRMLDCMSLAGCAGIAVGRLASFFNSTDRGQIVSTIRSMPWVYPVTNSVSGTTEYRLATFLIQAMVAGILFLILTVYTLVKGKKLRDGDTTLIFVLCYSAAQVVLDSTRYDSMYFRSNGFVSVVQVTGAVALAVTAAVFSIRLIRARGFRVWYLGLWAAMLALIGCAGYMEYHVQRHGDQAMFAYSVMSASLCLFVILALVIRFAAGKAGKSRAKGRYLQPRSG